MLVTRNGAVLLAATFCYLASTMLANPLVAGFAGTLGATAAMMGVLTALMNACSLVVRPIAGNLSDRLPKRRLALAGASLMLVTAFGQALAPSTALLAVMRLANGAGYSLCSVCMSTWFAETLPPARLGQGMGIFGLMNALGMAVGPALGIAVSDALGYRPALGLSAAFAALSLAGILLVRDGGATRGGRGAQGERDVRPRLRLLDRRAVPAAVVVALFTIPYMATQSFLVSYAEARGLDVPTGAFFTVYAVSLMALRVRPGGLRALRGGVRRVVRGVARPSRHYGRPGGAFARGAAHGRRLRRHVLGLPVNGRARGGGGARGACQQHVLHGVRRRHDARPRDRRGALWVGRPRMVLPGAHADGACGRRGRRTIRRRGTQPPEE